MVSSHGLSIRPRAIPAAGGCSVSVAAIMKMAIPTDIAPNIAIVNVIDKCNDANIDEKATILSKIPTMIPIIYPPRSGLVFDVYALGMVKTINAEAPRDAIIAVSLITSRNSNITKIATVASVH